MVVWSPEINLGLAFWGLSVPHRMHLKITDIEKQPDELWIQPSTIGSEFLVPKATGVRGEEWLVLSAAIATAAERAPALLSLRQEPVK